MMELKCILIRRSAECIEDAIEGRATLSDGISDYVRAHGWHFTEELAEYASGLMRNANGTPHRWTAAQVRKAAESLGVDKLPQGVTWGDIAYVANMAYADFCPEVVPEANCVRYAIRVARDPDGYDGMVFNRWLADVQGLLINVDWKKFV